MLEETVKTHVSDIYMTANSPGAIRHHIVFKGFLKLLMPCEKTFFFL